MNFAFWYKHLHGKLPLLFRITEVGAFFARCWSWNTLLKPTAQLRCRKSPLLSKFYILMSLQSESIITLAIPGLSHSATREGTSAGATATVGSHAVPSALPPAAAARESPRFIAVQASPRSARPLYEKAVCRNKSPEQDKRLRHTWASATRARGRLGCGSPVPSWDVWLSPRWSSAWLGTWWRAGQEVARMGTDTGVTTGLCVATPVSFKCHVYLEISLSNWERWNPVVQGVLRVTTEITSKITKLCFEKLL